MTFENIFAEAAAWLKGKGISPAIEKRKIASSSEVARFSMRTGLDLPTSFSSFFTKFSDGYEFSWERNDGEWGLFRMPTLAQLAKKQRDWIDYVEEFHTRDNLVDEELADKGMRIWKRMRYWVPFWDEGNGDHFAVDTRSGKIVYDQFCWYGNDERVVNGITAGRDLTDFVGAWSNYCFRRVKSQWWAEFVDLGRITWNEASFDPEFTRTKAEPVARPNDEERDDVPVASRRRSARSSSSAS